MLSKIIGLIWLILGVIWLIKPGSLKDRLTRKMNKKLKWIIFGFITLFSILILGSVFKAPGLLPKVVGIAGLFIAVKGILFLTSKTEEKVIGWWQKKPLFVFRIWALIMLLIGLGFILT
jgi:uncharacterized protein YhhL (DUF1145 family)